MKRAYIYLSLTLLVLITYSCQEQEDEEVKITPKIYTLEAVQSDVYRTVSVKGQVIGIEGAVDNYEFGIEYATNNKYPEGVSHTVMANQLNPEGVFTVDLKRLNSEQIYYYRAYCFDYNASQMYMGESKSFSYEWTSQLAITLDIDTVLLYSDGKQVIKATVTNGFDVESYPITWSSDDSLVAKVSENGEVTAVSVGSTVITATCYGKTASCVVIVKDYEYVDLGLSVKWATFNVGASSPEESGDFFAWGETDTKQSYEWSTYKYCNNANSKNLTKYNDSSSYGHVDLKNTLELEDDVAHVRWGGNWRMPTISEMEELTNTHNCTWTTKVQNDVIGFLITSLKPGYENCSIFLPVTGYRIGGQILNKQDYGYYWTSSLIKGQPDCAWCLDFYWSYGTGHCSTSNTFRRYGNPVRPVCP